MAQPAAQSTSRTLLIVGAIVAVAAVAAVVFFMRPQQIERDAPEMAASEPREEAVRSTELALRNETIAAVKALTEAYPSNVFVLGLMGTVYNQFGNTAEAERYWSRCLELDPAQIGAYDVLSVAYLRKEEFEKVVELSRRTAAAAPGAPVVNRRLAEALLELGELDDALAAIEKENAISPNNNEVLVILGRIQLQRRAYAEAVTAYERALELRPGDDRCYFGLATAYARLGQRDKAKEFNNKFASVRAVEDEQSANRRRATDVIAPAGPILAEALVDVGKTYQQYREIEKAEASWLRAAEVDPVNEASRRHLAGLYRSAKRHQKAAEMCAELTRLAPENAAYHHMSGLVFADLGQFDAAEQSLRRTVELAPQRPEGYATLARLLMSVQGRNPEARTLAQRAVELAPTAPNYALLSEACARDQDLQAALAAIKRAAELAPDNAQIRQAYDNLKQRAGAQ